MRFFNYERLTLWQKSRALVKEVYLLIRSFPSEEKFALSGQMRRAVVSIASNVAEGAGRTSAKEKLHFISIAYGSLTEISCQVTLASDLGYIDELKLMEIRADIEEIARIMSGYRESILKQSYVDYQS